MEYCQYEKANVIIEKNTKDIDRFTWTPFLRQAFVASCSWVIYFCMGLFSGSPTVIIPQMRNAANSTDAVSVNMASWLTSTFCYSALPWVVILPYTARLIGRKKTAIIVSFSTIASYLLFFFSSSTTYLLATEVLIGMTHASTVTLNVIVISEYTSPKYRGMLLAIKSASLSWGIWVSNAIGTFFYWKYIPLFGFICALYSLTVFFWPESPHWLASQKRFDETRQAHRWLKGIDDSSENELEQLIKSYSANVKKCHVTNLKFVNRKEFYMPLLLCIVATAQIHFSGKFVIAICAVEVMQKIMANTTTAYKSMLILDGFTVLSTYIGCIFARIFNRRTLLLTAASIALAFIYILALYLYLIKLSIISENSYVSLFLLAGFSSSISCGPIILSTTLYGELITANFKSISYTIIALTFFVLHGTLLKTSSLIFEAFSMHGTFLFFAIASSICAILMYFYLPETKDKTLYEIEQYFKDESNEEDVTLIQSLSQQK